MPWAKVRQAILWLGLLLCTYALWRVRDLATDATSRIDQFGWAAVCILLLSIWLLSVAAWQCYRRAYTGYRSGWRVGVRQVGLLLVGKYVPGGIFGFLARLYDEPGVSRQQLLWAGIAEQATGIAISAVLGGGLLLVAKSQNYAWLWFLLALPLLATCGLWILHQCGPHLPENPWFRLTIVSPDWKRMLTAVSLHLSQMVVWAALIIFLVSELYGLQGYSALGVAGTFLLAVVAGMLVVFAPGGIGVREAVLVGLTSHWLDMAQAIYLAALLRLLASALDVFSGALALAVGSAKKP